MKTRKCKKIFIIFDEGILINAPSIAITNDEDLVVISIMIFNRKYNSIKKLAKDTKIKNNNLSKTIDNYNYYVNKKMIFLEENIYQEK